MDRQTQMSVEDGVVRVTVRGEVKLATGGAAIAQASRVAQDAGSNLLLFDITQAQSREYHAVAMHHARDAHRTGIVKFRIAILGRAGDAKLSFLENVARNRGIRARSFTAEREAVRWLKASSP